MRREMITCEAKFIEGKDVKIYYPGVTVCVRSLKNNVQNNREVFKFVIVGGVKVGYVTKFHNTRTDTNPWKAFAGLNKDATFLGSFYDKTPIQAVYTVLAAVRKYTK